MAEFKYLEKSLTNQDCFTLKVKALRFFTASHPRRIDTSATNTNVRNSYLKIHGNMDAAIERSLKLSYGNVCYSSVRNLIISFRLSKHASVHNYDHPCCFVCVLKLFSHLKGRNLADNFRK